MRAMTEQQVVTSADAATIERLIAGDETTFMILVEQHQPTMLRLAQMYVSSRAVAEEVVQEAWIGILRGLPAFEGRSSLRTWMYKIVTNVAKTRGVREGRSLPFSALGEADDDPVDPSWFQGAGDPYPGGMARVPGRLARDPGGPASRPGDARPHLARLGRDAAGTGRGRPTSRRPRLVVGRGL